MCSARRKTSTRHRWSDGRKIGAGGVNFVQSFSLLIDCTVSIIIRESIFGRCVTCNNVDTQISTSVDVHLIEDKYGFKPARSLDNKRVVSAGSLVRDGSD